MDEVRLVEREALGYEAAHGDADDVGSAAVGVGADEARDVPGCVFGRAWGDVARRRVQWQVGEEEMEVGEMREGEGELEVAGEAAVEEDDCCLLVVVQGGE